LARLASLCLLASFWDGQAREVALTGRAFLGSPRLARLEQGALVMKREDPNLAFTLRVRLFRREHDARLIVIKAFDDLGWDSAGRVKLSCEVSHGGKVIFRRGQLYCAVHGASDGIEARELIMSLVAMKPGDTDEDYFSDYSPEQLEWVSKYGESLGCERESRYCDENGNVKKGKR